MSKDEKSRADVVRFDRWSRTYENSFTWRHFFEPVHEHLQTQVGAVAGKDVLDLGCGTGDMLRRFARAGAGRLAGLDPSGGMLEVARGLSGDLPNIEFFHATAESLPFPDEDFDIVTSCIAFHHFPDPDAALSEARRVLKPGGKLVICDMSAEGLGGRLMLAYGRAKAQDDHYYDRRSLALLMVGAGFEPVVTERVRRFPPAMLASSLKK